jgi:hypothetical protein
MQLDKAVRPPGIFAPARTYSIVRSDAGLHLIYTGRAMSLVRPTAPGVAGAAGNVILDRMATKRAAEIEKVEAVLRTEGVGAFKDSKQSMFVPAEQIRQVEIQEGAWTVAVVHAAKKIKLHFQGHDPQQVRALFAPYLRS